MVSGLGSDARFAGQWFAVENGLHQNWMRDYDATLGRYIQADPLGLVDGASVYGYALQNPARWSDPRGELVGVDDAVAGAALASAAAYASCVANPACRGILEDVGRSIAETLPYVAAMICPGALPLFWESRATKTPNTGEPGSTHINPGSGQVRHYGPDGKPLKDIDYDHEHGQPVPHVHDWVPNPSGGFPNRGDGRSPKPGEIPE